MAIHLYAMQTFALQLSCKHGDSDTVKFRSLKQAGPRRLVAPDVAQSQLLVGPSGLFATFLRADAVLHGANHLDLQKERTVGNSSMIQLEGHTNLASLSCVTPC